MIHFLRHFVVATLVLALFVRPAGAQWGVTISLHRTTFGGTSHDTTTGGTNGSFRPGSTPAVTLRVDRRLGRVTIALGARVSRSAIEISNKDVFVGLHHEVTTIEAAPEVRVRLVRTPVGARLHVYGGAVIGVWSFQDQTRKVTGGVAGVSGEFPLFAKLALEVRAGGGLTTSLFRDGELPPEFERRVTRRAEIGIGLRYGR